VGFPLAATVKVAFDPLVTVTFEGCVVIVGAVGFGNDATFCFAPAETGQRQSVSN
jgi:hypothetical protein